MTQLIQLNDGVEIPQLGFGVFKIPPEETEQAVSEALAVGYRHVDTAAAYGNEREVGRAVRAFGEDVFVTTKVWNDAQGRQRARRSCEESLERLGLDRIDLLLIHWPAPAQGLFVETWETFIELRDEGLVRSIGVSNFRAEDLDRLVEATGVTPSVNQIELHPRFAQSELRAKHGDMGIVTEAWSPLARGGDLLRDPVIESIAAEHGRTPAQVVLRWHLQIGNVVIPKSVTPSRIRENFDVFGFDLSDDQVGAINGLDRGERTGPDPNTFG